MQATEISNCMRVPSVAGRKFELIVIYVEYDPARFGWPFSRLKSYLSSVGDDKKLFLIVSNSDEGEGFLEVDRGTIRLQGNNINREFSGWQRGVEFIREQEINTDVVLLVNEAFESLGPSYLKTHNVNWLLTKCRLFKIVLGLVDTAWEGKKIQGKSARVWINTNCFFVPAKLLESLGNIVTVNETRINEFLPEDYPDSGEFFKKSSPVNSAFKEYLQKWLTEEWHGRFVPSNDTWPVFRAKTAAILNESLLSIRIRELGYIILPYDVPLFLFKKTRGAWRKMRRVLTNRGSQSFEEAMIEKSNQLSERP